MTDFNTNASAETSTEAKAPVITTAKHARFLAEAARKRADKLAHLSAEADAAAAYYDELAATLPESNPSSGGGGKVRPVIEVGTSVSFRFGRTTSTSKARLLVGVVKARKDGEDGKPEAYKIAVGIGFYEELFTVQPGAILLAGDSAEDNEADAALNAAANTVEGL